MNHEMGHTLCLDARRELLEAVQEEENVITAQMLEEARHLVAHDNAETHVPPLMVLSTPAISGNELWYECVQANTAINIPTNWSTSMQAPTTHWRVDTDLIEGVIKGLQQGSIQVEKNDKAIKGVGQLEIRDLVYLKDHSMFVTAGFHVSYIAGDTVELEPTQVALAGLNVYCKMKAGRLTPVKMSFESKNNAVN